MTAETFNFNVGDFSCIVLTDGRSVMTEADVSRIFAKDADRMLTEFRALSTPLALDRNLLLVQAGEQRILVDSGIGRLDPDDPGHLLDNLHAIGMMPQSITMVVLSHYHSDHRGGLLDSEGNPTFAHARLVVPKPEHDYWMHEEVLAQIDPTRAKQLRNTFAAYEQQLIVMDNAAEIVPGMCYWPASGHTPGHSAVLLESHGQRLLHFVDAIHLPLQLNAPDAVPSFDVQPDLAITSRRAVLQWTEAENLLVMGYHFPFPGVGHIQHRGDACNWLPIHNNTE